MFIPAATKVFDLVALNGMQWLMVAGVSIAPLVIMELQKKANEVLFGKVVYEYKESNYSEV